MDVSILRAVTALLSTCSRRLSRAARKLRGPHRGMKSWRNSSVIPFLANPKKTIGEELDEEEIWRRGIIMGEKCQPLDFSGAIYYDSDGRQLAGTPVLRSPMQSPLPALFVADPKS